MQLNKQSNAVTDKLSRHS